MRKDPIQIIYTHIYYVMVKKSHSLFVQDAGSIEFDGNDFILPVKIIDCVIPSDDRPVAMFTDPIGMPLTPGSIAVVHRHHERRA